MTSFEYRLELLKWELDNIESSIKKSDDLSNSNKNWAIVTWAGTLAVILRDNTLHLFIYATAIFPLIFMVVDAHWRKLQRRFIFRMNKISEFLNSQEFDTAFSEMNLSGFKILDPFSRLDKDNEALRNYISLKRMLRYPTVSLIYLGLAVLSVIMGLTINAN